MREIHQPKYYRLLARPPFCVSFPSIVYEIDIRPVTGCPQTRLEAVDMSGRARWTLCQRSERMEVLERAIYGDGFDVMAPTVPSLILDRLCAAGKAERMQRVMPADACVPS